MTGKEGIKAWVVTWEHVGDHAMPEKHVVGVFSQQTGEDFIKRFMQAIYDTETLTPGEIVHTLYRPSHKPYKPEYSHPPFSGKLICGHNPYLHGRTVKNLRFDTVDGEEVLLFDEIRIEEYKSYPMYLEMKKQHS